MHLIIVNNSGRQVVLSQQSTGNESSEKVSDFPNVTQLASGRPMQTWVSLVPKPALGSTLTSLLWDIERSVSKRLSLDGSREDPLGLSLLPCQVRMFLIPLHKAMLRLNWDNREGFVKYKEQLFSVQVLLFILNPWALLFLLISYICSPGMLRGSSGISSYREGEKCGSSGQRAGDLL